MIGSEALPFSKTGGLADVLGALPPAIARLGWDVTLFLPRYRGVHAGEFRRAIRPDGRRLLLRRRPVRGTAGRRRARDARRRAGHVRPRLSSTASAMPTTPTTRAVSRCSCGRHSNGRSVSRIGPSIVHAHDWQAGLAPVYLRSMYALNPTIGGARSVFTIHNLAYQGRFDAAWMPQLDLPWELYTMQQLEFHGHDELSERWGRERGCDHDGQPAVRERDPDAGRSASASTAFCGRAPIDSSAS